jgi:uncharacterized protein (DUF1501 family)
MKRTKLLDLEAASRRQMLKTTLGGCAALTNTSLISTILNMSATNTVVAQSPGLTGYKAMVCLFLFGGNDAFNMLSPATGTDTTGERGAYVTARGGINSETNAAGLAQAANPANTITDTESGRQFMLHPSMPEMKALYDADKLAFIGNIGSLVEPTTRAEYNSRVNLPLGLFSHSDLQQHWMTSVPQSRSQVTGWTGRMADLVAASSASQMNTKISMCMALGSTNLMQTGGSVVPYVIGESGAQEVGRYDIASTSTQTKIFTQLTDDYLSRSYSNLLQKTFAQQNKTALQAAIEFNDATQTDAVKALVDSYFPLAVQPNGSTGFQLQRDLRSVARAIAASGGVSGVTPVIGQSRQSFFVGHGSYDMHDDLISGHVTKLSEVSQALKQFQDCMDALNLTEKVVLFSASDFSRTLNSNGKGSDHAWGGVSFVMGGPVTPKKVLDYPTSLAATNPIDLGRGRFIPSVSVDQLACELAMWYGVANDNNMEILLPNIRNFAPAGTTYPLGILT